MRTDEIDFQMLFKSKLSFILLSYITLLGISQTFTGIVAPSAKPPAASSRIATTVNRGKKTQRQTLSNTVDEGEQNRSQLINNNRPNYSFSVIINR